MDAAVSLAVSGHPLLELAAFATEFSGPIGEVPSPAWLRDLLRAGAPAPFAPDDALRGAVRDLLRHGGFKPTGRSKPASEYLWRAAAEGGLGSINVAVDAANAASLHSGLPISVVDLDRTAAPLRIALAEAGARYVFNASGQELDAAGLPCLHDAAGPCANAVKDAQRTKTHAGTVRTLSLVWGTRAAAGSAAATAAWYRDLVERAGGRTVEVG